jgi:hypothetical protein
VSELPHGLAPALHLLAPWWQRPGVWLLAALALLLLVRWLRRRRRSRGRAEVAPPRTTLPPAPAAAGGIAAAVRRLRDRYRGSPELRRGLQELSDLLRGHFSAALPAAQRQPGLTALQLAGRLGDGPGARLLRLLAGHQFGRREPTGDDFDAVCELAEESVAGGVKRGAGLGRGRR